MDPDKNPPADTKDAPAEPPEGQVDGTEGEAGGEGGADEARRLRNAQSAAKRAAQERDRLKTELAEIKAKLGSNAPEADKTLDAKAIAEQAKAEVLAGVLRDRAIDKIEVLAAKDFANPDLAKRLLQSDVDNFVTDGKVDTDAIRDALSDLLSANPYLAAGPEKRFQGSGDGGVRGTGKTPDLDTQIAAAAAAGDVRKQLHLQNQKLLPHIQKMAFGQS